MQFIAFLYFFLEKSLETSNYILTYIRFSFLVYN